MTNERQMYKDYLARSKKTDSLRAAEIARMYEEWPGFKNAVSALPEPQACEGYTLEDPAAFTQTWTPK
jgi:hypothetical protein